MPNFLSALRTRVMELEPELNGVFLSEAGSETDFPYCIIDLLWQDETTNNLDDEWYKEINLQFTFFAHSDVQANTMGRKVKKGLMPKQANPPLVFDGDTGEDEYEMTRWPGRFRGPSIEPEATVDGGEVWRTQFDYTWLVGVNDV